MEGPVASTGKGRGVYRVFVGKPERDHLEDLRRDGREISKQISQEIGWKAWTRFLRLNQVQGAHSNVAIKLWVP
jgi:hypothetical protein